MRSLLLLLALAAPACRGKDDSQLVQQREWELFEVRQQAQDANVDRLGFGPPKAADANFDDQTDPNRSR
jgi:hypothetical protein